MIHPRRSPWNDLAIRLSLAIGLLFVSSAAVTWANGTCATSWDETGLGTVYGDPDPESAACQITYSIPQRYGVALGEPYWSNSAGCGRCVEVSGAAGTVIAQVIDLCAECGLGRLDLTIDAWNAVIGATPSVQPITWAELPCPVTTPVRAYIRPGSSIFFFEVSIRNHRNGIAQVQIISEPSQPVLPRSGTNYFTYNLGVPLTLPMTLEITDVHGETVTVTINSIVGDTEVPSNDQFPICLEAGAPGEPADLTVTSYDRITGTLGLNYTPGCDATDHSVVSGPLTSVSTLTYSNQTCGLGATGSAAYQAGNGSEFFILVGNNGSEEGSYGRNSSGVERAEDLADPSCTLTQSLGATCVP